MTRDELRARLGRLWADVRQNRSELGRRLGVSPQQAKRYVDEIVNGSADRIGHLEVPTALRWARGLDITVSDVLAATGQADVDALLRQYYAQTDSVKASGDSFVPVPLLSRPIAAGQPLDLTPDPENDSVLAFAERFVRRFVRPICLRIGPREESMSGAGILPRDIIAIDQDPEKRRAPLHGAIFAVNFGPLTGEPGGAVKRIEVHRGIIIISSEHPDKHRYPTLALDVREKNLLDILRGEVVWHGQYIGSGKAGGR